MIKFINILTNVISESKRYKLQPEEQTRLMELTNSLWALRSRDFPKRKLVNQMEFNTADGSDGLVKIYMDSTYKNFAELNTEPKDSLDPRNFIITLNPLEFTSKKTLYNTLYHELIHVTDPNFSIDDTKVDEKYLGSFTDFKTISNEFLDALYKEFAIRSSKINKFENKHLLSKSLNNILDYFSKHEPLSKTSLELLIKINDKYLSNSNNDKDFTNVPSQENTSELSTEPYFLKYINTVKKSNPKMWPRFLTMLYKTADEIEDLINK